MLRADHIRRLVPGVSVAVVAPALLGLLLALGAPVDLVMKAAGIPKQRVRAGRLRERRACAGDPGPGDGAAIAPLALIVGGVVLMFGGRRGMQIVGTSLGVLLLLGSVTALID